MSTIRGEAGARSYHGMRTLRRAWGLSALPALLTACGQTDRQRPTTQSGEWERSLESATEELMREYHVPGVAVAVLERGMLTAVSTFGYADHSGMVPVQRNTVFQAASLGKPLFAHAVLSADVEEHRLTRRYSPCSFAVAVEEGRPTLRHLLSHTSGLFHDEVMDARCLAAEPGRTWKYSGLGYVVLQESMERTMGQRLEDGLAPAGTLRVEMENTSWSPPAAGSAQGHDRAGRPLIGPTSRPNAASSLHTTVVDYARFMERIFTEISDGRRAPVASALMLRPEVAVDTTLDLYWGLGWGIAKHDGETLFLHWGSNPGFKALAVGSIDRRTAVVVLTNGDNGLDLAVDLVPIVLGRDYPFLDFFMLHPDD